MEICEGDFFKKIKHSTFGQLLAIFYRKLGKQNNANNMAKLLLSHYCPISPLKDTEFIRKILQAIL